jgi:hypothetical protein
MISSGSCSCHLISFSIIMQEIFKRCLTLGEDSIA